MSEVEGIGIAVTGALAARAVEPVAGEGPEGAAVCLNCGTALVGEYCHHCGQHGHLQRSLSAFWYDFLHGVLHFEGKIWRTLPLLVWRPGELTRRYVEGERSRFLSPLALFLFSVFLMFAVFSAVGGPELTTPEGIEASEGIETGRHELKARLATLEAERAKAVADGKDTRVIDKNIRDVRGQLEFIGIVKGEESAAPAELGEISGLGWLDDAYRKAKENPSLLIYKLQSNAYKFSWALIPISVPFVWLLFFWKRRFRAYDHAVFVTYSIAFMSLLAILLAILAVIGVASGPLVMAATFIPPIHMYRQLRGAYDLSVAGALWRTIFLICFAFVAAAFYFALLLTLGLIA